MISAGNGHGRLAELVESTRASGLVPPPDPRVLDEFRAAAATTGTTAIADDALVAAVAAELMVRAFEMQHLRADADCGSEDVLLGDLCLVSAANLLASLERPDLEALFAEATTTAALAGDYREVLREAVVAATDGPPGSVRELGAGRPPAREDDDMSRLELQLGLALAADPELVRAPMLGQLSAGGKRLRPRLALLCARLGPRFDQDRAAALAVALELIHNATLAHDDVVDESPLRRGRPAIHTISGAPTAIRVGVYYFGRAASILADLGNPRVTATVMAAVTAVSRSQLEEFHLGGAQNFEESAYIDVVEGKTAALLAACCGGGAALSGAGGPVVDALHQYGRNLGIAFQIVDDVLDFSQTSGKVVAQDLRQSIGSLPLVYAMRDPEASAWIHARLDSGKGFDADEAAAVVRASGALDQASRRAEHYRDLALASLEPVKEGPDKTRLATLADYTVLRQA